ncbi:FkbM family methyltransferase [Mariprofundus ferrooxydans]|uniref:FkbM family methyltransferase n=1 Tax=Mariprofundus ferrooxydans TaxID=314344 RepID=UPI001430A2DA|nr:FkbM family methyltransferase [Mariprofundus ferrooxydans]
MVLPVALRRGLKDAIGMPRWLNDDYYPLRKVGIIPEKHIVFDLGACHGWFTKCWLEYNPTAEVHCFEPTSSVFREILTPALASDERVTLVKAAVGAEKGQLELHEAEFHKANSFCDFKADWKLGDEISFNSSEMVDVITLADYIKENEISAIKVMKIDVQGFEIEALKGLGEFVDIVEYIYVETSIHPVYEDAPDFRDVFTFLTDRGFKLLDIKTTTLGEEWLSECDLLFKKVK